MANGRKPRVDDRTMACGGGTRQSTHPVNDSATDAPEPFVAAMMRLHEDLDRRFFLHQQALLDRDFLRATAALEAFAACLFDHMHDEETLVLPRYRALGGDATDAPVRLFLGEHAKMREFLADFGLRLAALREKPDDRLLLELFDREATYKNLTYHHDSRERHGLYPFLASRLSAAEGAKLLAARKWTGG